MITNLIDTMITNLHSLFTFHQFPTNVLLLHDPVQDSSLHLVIMFLYFPWIFDGSLFFPCLSCPWHFKSWLAYDFVEYPSVWVFWCFLITRLKLGIFFCKCHRSDVLPFSVSCIKGFMMLTWLFLVLWP